MNAYKSGIPAVECDLSFNRKKGTLKAYKS